MSESASVRMPLPGAVTGGSAGNRGARATAAAIAAKALAAVAAVLTTPRRQQRYAGCLQARRSGYRVGVVGIAPSTRLRSQRWSTSVTTDGELPCVLDRVSSWPKPIANPASGAPVPRAIAVGWQRRAHCQDAGVGGDARAGGEARRHGAWGVRRVPADAAAGAADGGRGASLSRRSGQALRPVRFGLRIGRCVGRREGQASGTPAASHRVDAMGSRPAVARSARRSAPLRHQDSGAGALHGRGARRAH